MKIFWLAQLMILQLKSGKYHKTKALILHLNPPTSTHPRPLTERSDLTITYNAQFFSEWLINLAEITDSEKPQRDRVKNNYISLFNCVKMVVIKHSYVS
jgi:hypothetical protein